MAADDKHLPESAVTALVEVMEQRRSKTPGLAEKQKRLLEILGDGSFVKRLAASNDSANLPSGVDDLNRPETEEADGFRAGAQRLLKAQRQSEALRCQASDRAKVRHDNQRDGE